MSESIIADSSRPFALCLSGGGFRATFFHLGVLRYLKDAGKLKQVEHIFSVSGGSIVAAHLAINWNRYQTDFDEAAEEVIRFGRSDLLWRLFRWPWNLFRYGLTHRLEVLALSKLYRNAELSSLAPPGGPQFHVLATDLRTGGLFAFSHNEFASLPPGGHLHRAWALHSTPVARAVAASCALPVIFRFVPVGDKDVRRGVQHGDRQPFQDCWLADGGIFDNLGVVAAQHMAPGAQVIVSDASAPLRVDERSSGNSLFRPFDVLMNRVVSLGRSDPVTTGTAPLSQPLRIAIGETLGEIRTSLNAFSKPEIRMLMWAGFLSASRTLPCEVPDSQPSTPSWSELKGGWLQRRMFSTPTEAPSIEELEALSARLVFPNEKVKPQQRAIRLAARIFSLVATKVRCHVDVVPRVLAVVALALFWVRPERVVRPAADIGSISLPIGLEVAGPRGGSLAAISANGDKVAFVASDQGRVPLMFVAGLHEAPRPVPESGGAVAAVFNDESGRLGFFAADGDARSLLLKEFDQELTRTITRAAGWPTDVRCGVWKEDVIVAASELEGLFIARLETNERSPATVHKLVPGPGLGCPAIGRAGDELGVLFESPNSGNPSVRFVDFDGKVNRMVLDRASEPHVVNGRSLVFKRDSAWFGCSIAECRDGSLTRLVDIGTRSVGAVAGSGVVSASLASLEGRKPCLFVSSDGAKPAEVDCALGLRGPHFTDAQTISVECRGGTKSFQRRGDQWVSISNSCEDISETDDSLDDGAGLSKSLRPWPDCSPIKQDGLVVSIGPYGLSVKGRRGKAVPIKEGAEPVWDSQRRGQLVFRRGDQLRLWTSSGPKEGRLLRLTVEDSLGLLPSDGTCESRVFDARDGQIVFLRYKGPPVGATIEVARFEPGLAEVQRARPALGIRVQFAWPLTAVVGQ